MVEFDSELLTNNLPAKLILYSMAMIVILYLAPMAKLTLLMKILIAIIMLPITWVIAEVIANR